MLGDRFAGISFVQLDSVVRPGGLGFVLGPLSGISCAQFVGGRFLGCCGIGRRRRSLVINLLATFFELVRLFDSDFEPSNQFVGASIQKLRSFNCCEFLVQPRA